MSDASKRAYTLRLQPDFAERLVGFAREEERSVNRQIIYMLKVGIRDWAFLAQRAFERQQLLDPEDTALHDTPADAEALTPTNQSVQMEKEMADIIARMAARDHRDEVDQIVYMLDLIMTHWEELHLRAIERRRAARGGDAVTHGGEERRTPAFAA